ncbi:hypothetical protein [Sandaracinus amylolyticus]|uniref:Uncharacterized protein n=1 Tax=Sandaracinus amylolyticus TaxID=927083 RepID=A0A0F6SG64_9BACT|nr:hypothetical protein [Sandaracinus amylolyticus]AKF08149.1 hypothetical protein DB32_005298 [Sandaracinus amylolyticus]
MIVAALAMMIASACGGSSASSARPAVGAAERVRWGGALVDLVPRDATVVVIARPEEMLREGAARAVLEAIAPDEHLERYRQHTGIDPRRIEELVWAESRAGSLLLVRGPFSAPLAVAEMGHRMLPIESSSEAPFVRRAGHYQGARRDLVALADHVLAVISGSPELAEDVLGRARHGEAGGALGAEPAASLLMAHRSSPLVVVAPQPLGLPPGSGVALLLARERAMLVAGTPRGERDIGLVAELRGEFPPGADENFRALFASLASSDLGVAIGMPAALETFTVDADAEHVVLRATIPAGTLAAALRVLFEAEITELVEGTPEHGGAPTSALTAP